MVYIYVLVDPINNDIKYCGKTINPKERYIGHLKEKKTQKEKRDWICELKTKKLKPVLEILDEVDDENWDFWEKYWICQLKSWGFNLFNKTNGGEISVVGFKHTEETKRKITKSQTGRKLTEEWKQNISNGRRGLKFSKEHIKKLSESHKNQVPINKKPILQIDINNGKVLNEFESIKKALYHMKKDLENYNISKVCKGKLKSAFGYYWCYKENFHKFNFEYYKRNQKTIYQYDKSGNFINRYESIKEASKHTNIDRCHISHVANGDSLSAGGYIWKFEKDTNHKDSNIEMSSGCG